MAVHTLGVSWQHQKMNNYDNLTLVDIWVKDTIKSPEVMALVWLLYFGAACYNINVSIQHISGTKNKIADAISHFLDIHFRELAPDAEVTPTNIPAWPAQAFKIAS